MNHHGKPWLLARLGVDGGDTGGVGGLASYNAEGIHFSHWSTEEAGLIKEGLITGFKPREACSIRVGVRMPNPNRIQTTRGVSRGGRG